MGRRSKILSQEDSSIIRRVKVLPDDSLEKSEFMFLSEHAVREALEHCFVVVAGREDKHDSGNIQEVLWLVGYRKQRPTQCKHSRSGIGLVVYSRQVGEEGGAHT